MADVGRSAVRIIDSDNDVVSVTNNKLDVNATISAGDLNIGNVDMHLNGGVEVLGNAGNVAAGVLRVTLASNDEHFGEVGAAAVVDGTIHGQLRYIGDNQATSNKQPSLGTAGSASANVITVQGIASMTPLTVDLAGNNDVTVTGTVTANAGTNLNTSALSTHAKQDTIITHLS